jgi:hypothetical protein
LTTLDWKPVTISFASCLSSFKMARFIPSQ